MKLWKVSLFIVLFLIILSIFRSGWVMFFGVNEHEQAMNGKIDLSEIDFTNDDIVALDGEWEFYPEQFIFFEDAPNIEKQFDMVPNNWRENDTNTKPFDTFGYGTYRLTIQLPETEGGIYGIRANVASAANVYIDGQLVTSFGKPATSEEAYDGKLGPFSFYFEPETDEIELVIHVANFGHPYDGGIHNSILFGNEQAIDARGDIAKISQILVSVIYVLHGLYAVILFFIGRGKYNKNILLFGLMLFIHSFAIVIDDDAVLQLPFDMVWSYKTLLIFLISPLMALLTFVRYFFDIKSRVFPWLVGFFAILIIATLIMPAEYLYVVPLGYAIFYLGSMAFFFVRTIQIVLKGHEDAIFILLFLASYFSNMLWGMLINLNIVNAPFYPFDFLITIFIIVLILFKRQISLFKQNEQHTIKLQEIDKRKDEFLANTSHELRNPLHGIINITQTVLDDKEHYLSKQHRHSLQLLIRVARQMSFTLNDLLDISRLQEGGIRLKLQATNLHSNIIGVIDIIRFIMQGKNIQIIMKVPKDFPLVYADSSRLVQILFNILHNAVKFTDEGTIKIEAKVEKKMAVISISDTGIGMTKEMQQKVFIAYEQANEHKTAIEGGIGLGLTISRQLVELHGGDISVQSKLEKGSTFTFTIPLTDEDAREEGEAEVAATVFTDVPMNVPGRAINEVETTEKPIRILIVDDDPVNLHVLNTILGDEYHIEATTNGIEALKLLEKGVWDLVITDAMMPYMSGYELTEKIREKFTVSELPVLLLTARAQQEHVDAGFRSGVNDYVIKPVDALELKARVRALTDLKRSVNEQLQLEAAWLQAQIQPHFLFNTLNTIASLGVTDTTRMLKLLEKFGDYLHKSFNMQNTDAFVPIQYELDLTRSYAYIEQERFGDRLEVVCGVVDEFNFKIPPLTIQPIVENAINHGIMKKIDGGTVWVRINEYDTHYCIEIEDDGVGLTEEKIKNVLQTKPRPKKSGIGLFNTNRRLIKLYGKGLTIKSKVGEGTVVSFEVPKE